jgi:hypothetical protein
MRKTEADIIAEAQEIGPFEEKIGQPGTLLAALEHFYGNDSTDEQSGDVEAPTGHFYRVDRWIVQTDSAGFNSIYTYDTEDEAKLEFVKMENDFDVWNQSA